MTRRPDLDDGKTHSPRAFCSLLVGFLSAVVMTKKPEERARTAALLRDLVLALVSAYGKTLEYVVAMPRPPALTDTDMPVVYATASFFGTLASASAPGVQEAACRVLARSDYWERVLPYVIDPVGMSGGVAQQHGMVALGIVSPKGPT